MHHVQEELMEQSVVRSSNKVGLGAIDFWLDAVCAIIFWLDAV
jgi:hypothetical protein